MIRDDVNYFDSLYCGTGSATLQLNVNWPHPEKPVVMKLACNFTAEEKSEYVLQILSTREAERERLRLYLERKQQTQQEDHEHVIKADVEHDRLKDKYPGNNWWGKRLKKHVEIGSHVTGRI